MPFWWRRAQHHLRGSRAVLLRPPPFHRPVSVWPAVESAWRIQVLSAFQTCAPKQDDEMKSADHNCRGGGELAFLWGSSCARKYINSPIRFSQQLCEVNAIISVLQVRKLGPREVNLPTISF